MGARYLRPLVFAPVDAATPGGYHAFTDGVTLDSASHHVEVNCTGIDSTTLSGTKLRSNGTAITAPGAFGTNCTASGVVAA